MYVTSRPDFQKMKVMSWLAEHNFPYGLVTFGNGISKDLQRHKTEFLRYLVNDVSNFLLYKARSRGRIERWAFRECPSTLRKRGSSEIKLSTTLGRFKFHECTRVYETLTGVSESSRKSHESRRDVWQLRATQERDFGILSTNAWQEFTENEFGDRYNSE